MTFEERVKEFNEIFQNDGTVYQANLLIPDIVEDDYFKKPKLDDYEIRKYSRKTSLDTSEIKKVMNQLIKENVSKSPIFSYLKRKSEFYEMHINEIKEKLEKELVEREELQEKKFLEEESARIKKQYEKDLEEYKISCNPTEEWLDGKYQDYLKKVNEKIGGAVVRSGNTAYIEKLSDGSNRYSIISSVDNLNEFGNKYLFKYRVTEAGNLSKRQKSDKQIEEEYVQNVASIAFKNAICLFNVCLAVKEVLITAYISNVDPETGIDEDRCIYSVIIPRELVKKYKMENLNPVAALCSLVGNVDIRKERELYFVEPIIWNEETKNHSSENEYSLDIDFRRMNCPIVVPKGMENYESQMMGLKSGSKEIVIKKGLYQDEFDAENYAMGISKFLLILSTIEVDNTELFYSENSETLLEIFNNYFEGNNYAMGEIGKMVENHVFEKIINGDENILSDSYACRMIRTILNSDND